MRAFEKTFRGFAENDPRITEATKFYKLPIVVNHVNLKTEGKPDRLIALTGVTHVEGSDVYHLTAYDEPLNTVFWCWCTRAQWESSGYTYWGDK